MKTISKTKCADSQSKTQNSNLINPKNTRRQRRRRRRNVSRRIGPKPGSVLALGHVVAKHDAIKRVLVAFLVVSIAINAIRSVIAMGIDALILNVLGGFFRQNLF